VLKARAVKRGFLENKAIADGYDFDYYSNVVKLHAVRVELFSGRKLPNRVIKVKDVSTAFLQSDPYPDGKVKYIWFRHPDTRKIHYYRQTGPIYGEAAAPVLWEKTIAPWFVKQGFDRGKNEPSVFWHAERQLILLLYVDDVLADGNEEDVDWIFELLAERFDTKEEEILLPGTVIDYLGLHLVRDEHTIYMVMRDYIERACRLLEVDGSGREVPTPITQAVDPTTDDLTVVEKKKFLTALGMLGWLAQTVRMDVAYCYSRLAQHSAKPNKSALAAVLKAFKYLYQTRDLALAAPFDTPEQSVLSIKERYDTSTPRRVFSDSDHAGNAEVQNKRRSQNGGIITLNDAPVLWMSKASSVVFACEAIGEAHADVSSAAVETYAAGNMTFEVMGFSYVVEEMGLEMDKPFVLEMDNEAARTFIKGNGGRTKMKHIDCRMEWVQTLRNKDIIETAHVPSEDNLADMFTKILPTNTFKRLRDQMMHVCTPA